MSEIDSTYKKFSCDITQSSQAWKFSSRILMQPSTHMILERAFLKICLCLNYKTVGGSENLRGQIEFQLVVDEWTSGPSPQSNFSWKRPGPGLHWENGHNIWNFQRKKIWGLAPLGILRKNATSQANLLHNSILGSGSSCFWQDSWGTIIIQK